MATDLSPLGGNIPTSPQSFQNFCPKTKIFWLKTRFLLKIFQNLFWPGPLRGERPHGLFPIPTRARQAPCPGTPRTVVLFLARAGRGRGRRGLGEWVGGKGRADDGFSCPLCRGLGGAGVTGGPLRPCSVALADGAAALSPLTPALLASPQLPFQKDCGMDGRCDDQLGVSFNFSG